MTDRPPAMLIDLPQGFNVSGVTMWGVRLANALAARGGSAGLIVHALPPGQSRLDVPLHAGVRVWDASDLTPLRLCAGDLSRHVPLYRRAAEALADPVVVLSPNLHGESYGAAACLAQTMPERVRVIGWQHSDIAYDARLLAHYEPMLHAFVGVSGVIAEQLGRAHPGRRAHVREIAYGVEAEEAPARREPLAGRAVRLVYTGRIEHEQKRVGALIVMSDVLSAQGVAHELTLLGDGPASAEVDALCAARPRRVRRVPACGPTGVRAMLRGADAFVLASRYEGLSISMLEALWCGCVPIIARVRSGAAQAVREGVTGLFAETGPDDDAEAAGHAMARAVACFAVGDAPAMSRAGVEDAWARFGLARHVDAVAALLREVVDAPPRPWPATRACAFASCGSAPGGGSGSVPPDGAARVREALDRLRGRTIALYGGGRHTIELASVLAESELRFGVRIACIIDDDPAQHGQRLCGWPVVAREAAAALGATDVLVSSWMHHDAMLARREAFERLGLTLRGVYPAND